MTINLKEDERLDDLQRNGYKLIQNTKIFCFGIDAVLLCSFTKVNEGDKVLDLCTGNGVIPILLKGRTKGSRFSGLEIQDINVDMAKRSVEYNGIGEFVDIVKGDVKEASGIFGGASFDVVTCNPPYMKVGTGFKNPESAVAIARHEVECDFGDVAKACSHSLKLKGKAFFVHRPKHLISILEDLRREHLEPKRIQMVHSFAHSPATLVLIEGVKGGGEQLVVESPLIIYKEEGEYTDELLRLYGKLD